MTNEPTYVAFAGERRIAAGPLAEVLPILKERFDDDPSELIVIFQVESGRQVDFDLRGTVEEVLERAVPGEQRGPGRPRLGVTSREITLLPRHWEWLEDQPSGVSAALRRLVEQAIRSEGGREKARRMRNALAPFMAAMAGDRPGYEEACRALYAGDFERFETHVGSWPADVREHAVEQMRRAAALESEAASA